MRHTGSVIVAGVACWLAGSAAIASAQDLSGLAGPRQPIVGPIGPPKLAIEPIGPGEGLAPDIALGERAPHFSLQDSDGHWRGLDDLAGHWAVIIFDENRKVLLPLSGVGARLDDLGVQMVAVAPDSWHALETFATRTPVHCELLSDPSRQVSLVFGMYDPEDDAIHPGVVMIDGEGVVRMLDMDEIPSPARLLAMAEATLTGATPLASR